MDHYNILYAGQVPNLVREELENNLPEGFSFTFFEELGEKSKTAALEEADFLLGFPRGFTSKNLFSAKRLKMVQLLSAGYDYFDVELAGKNGVPVANNGGANSIAVAEHTIMMILAIYKKLCKHQNGLKKGVWVRERNHSVDMYELRGKTIGIIGFGNIGKSLAQCLQGFKVKLLCYDVVRNEKAEEILGVKYSELEELLRNSDIVSIHVPLLESTRNLIGKKELKIMKSNSILVNTARGGIVDEEALFEALTTGKIAGAALDVFEKEAKIQKGEHLSPIFSLENVVITPHYAGHTMDTWYRRIENGYNNIQAFLKGDQKWVVNENSLKMHNDKL